MHQRDTLVILDDDGRRLAEMQRRAGKLDLRCEIFRTAPECNEFLRGNLPRVRLISLDCDLDDPTDAEGNSLLKRYDPEEVAKRQSGKEVVAFLVTQPERVPGGIHSANPREPELMEESLRESGFPEVRRIKPFNDLMWVRQWIRMVTEMIETEVRRTPPA